MTAALALSSPQGCVDWLTEAGERTSGLPLEVASAIYDALGADGTADFLNVCIAYRDMQPACDPSQSVASEVNAGIEMLEHSGLVVRVDDEITLTLAPLYNLTIDINSQEGI